MALTLVVLAAGMGSRYGGLKQIDPVGPSGETVLDYAVFDALRAGFQRVVFVIRHDFEAVFREKIGSRYLDQIDVGYVFQALDALPAGFSPPPGREKPWGTGHAVWCARDAVQGSFAVINADDFYGADSLAQLGDFLRGGANGASGADARGGAAGPASPTAPPAFAMVGFRLANTLSEHGAVSRGVCALAERGELKSIVEQTNIQPTEVGAGKKFSGEEIVSMNCWGFTPALWPRLDRLFGEFIAKHAGEVKAEFYLPAAVSAMIDRREVSVQVLATNSAWFGVTYREDKPRVQRAIAQLVQSGRYPERLF